MAWGFPDGAGVRDRAWGIPACMGSPAGGCLHSSWLHRFAALGGISQRCQVGPARVDHPSMFAIFRGGAFADNIPYQPIVSASGRHNAVDGPGRAAERSSRPYETAVLALLCRAVL